MKLPNFTLTVGIEQGGYNGRLNTIIRYPPPQYASAWKTLYTIIDGCPAQAAGNLATDAYGQATGWVCGDATGGGDECVRQFEIPIPQGLPDGNATFAWTRLNRIGDREYYMSCSPVIITGGTTDNGGGGGGLS